DAERCRRVADIAFAHARLRHIPPAQRRVAIVLSAYPTKHSRVGNAVGLDTPVSAVRLLRAMRDAGYVLGDGFPGMDLADETEAGNPLIRALIGAGGQDEEWLTAEQLAGNAVRIPAERYREWIADLPGELIDAVNVHWGEPR